jgi:hypothetical protein
MGMISRFGALIAMPGAAVLLSACGGSTSGNVTAAASATNAPTAIATPAPSATAAPATRPPRTAAPQPTSSVNRADPGQFGGEWKGTGTTLDVSSDNSANATYFIGVLCSSASPAPMPCDDDSVSPTIPGGQLKLQITEVVTTGGVAVASGEVRDSSDPRYPENSIIKFTLKNGVITSPIGSFTKVPIQD